MGWFWGYKKQKIQLGFLMSQLCYSTVDIVGGVEGQNSWKSVKCHDRFLQDFGMARKAMAQHSNMILPESQTGSLTNLPLYHTT